MDLTKDELWELREQITLNSIYYADYRNGFGIEEHACCSFFDGYLDFIQELMEDDGKKDVGNNFFEYLDEYDNADNLWEWYFCHDYNCFPIDIDFVVSEAKYDIDDKMVDIVWGGDWDDKTRDEQYTEITDGIMEVIKDIEDRYPELVNNEDEKWYDELRDEKIEEYLEYGK